MQRWPRSTRVCRTRFGAFGALARQCLRSQWACACGQAGARSQAAACCSAPRTRVEIVQISGELQCTDAATLAHALAVFLYTFTLYLYYVLPYGVCLTNVRSLSKARRQLHEGGRVTLTGAQWRQTASAA